MDEFVKFWKRWAKQVPYIRPLVEERDRLRLEVDRLHSASDHLRTERDLARTEAARYETWAPPGHFYSPLVSIEEVRLREEQVFGAPSKTIPGVDLRESQQLELLKELSRYYPELDFPYTQQPSRRYYVKNPHFSFADAIFYYLMIRRLQPRRIVEIGSGFSSCVALDTNETWFNNSIQCTFVDPYPELLKSLLKPGDQGRSVIVSEGVHDVEERVFLDLEENDILFIDSTHVSKTNSDVNYLLFEVLPLLKRGVIIHVHDIFFPFEYPRAWIYEGRSWNECYVLRAFLHRNPQFQIELFTSFLVQFHQEFLQEHMPLCLGDTASIWLKKLGESELADGRKTRQQYGELPSRIDLTRLTHPRQLLSGWHANEGLLRWMSKHAEVRLKTPKSSAPRLWIEALNHNGRPFDVAAYANGVALGTRTIEAIGPLQADFALPLSLPMTDVVVIALEVSEPYKPPGDSRDLGLAFGVIEIR